MIEPPSQQTAAPVDRGCSCSARNQERILTLLTDLVLAVGGDNQPVPIEAATAVPAPVRVVSPVGAGTVVVDGEKFALEPGRMVFVPKGCLRATRSSSGEFAYLTVHLRRGLVRLATRGGTGDDIGGRGRIGRRSTA